MTIIYNIYLKLFNIVLQKRFKKYKKLIIIII